MARPLFSSFTSLPEISPPPPEPPPPAAPPVEPPADPPAAELPPPPPPPPPVVVKKPAAPPPPVPAAPVPAEAVGPPPLAMPAEAEAPPANVFVSALRRWPWLAVGLIGGIAAGLLIHTQRPPVYQSHARLLVIKNRAETGAGGGPDVRTQYVEDYVATQVEWLQSSQMLRLAALKMYERNARDPFQMPLPGTPQNPDPLVAFIAPRFTVERVREKGSTTLSNVLGLTVKSLHPADAPKYLDAIIEAYQSELRTVYEETSTNMLIKLDADIRNAKESVAAAGRDINANTRELQALSQEPLDGIRARITTNRNLLGAKSLQKREDELGLELIATVQNAPRSARMAVMERLGVKSDRDANVGGFDAKNPQDVLFALELKKSEMGQRLGAQHPEMQALSGQIEALRKRLEEQGANARAGDELDRHRLKLETELTALNTQIKELRQALDDDEKLAAKMTTFQRGLDDATKKEAAARDAIEKKTVERRQIEATKNAGGFNVRPITPPTAGVQIAPVLWQSLLIGGVLGLLLGGTAAVGTELSDRSFRSPAEIRKRLGVPVLGHVPRITADAPPTRPSATGLDPTLVGFLRPMSAEAEAYKGIRTQLYFSTQGRGHQVIQVTSPTPGDGKSTLAANLAISIAQSGKRVVLLDCDFRKPRVHRLFNIQHPEVGLASVVAGESELEAAVRTTEVENLSVMPCGPRPANPAELLTSPKFQELLAELKGMYDFVIVDTPPVLAVTDPAAVAPRVDGVLLVFRMTKTARPSAERAREQLGAVGARVLGVVVNAASARSAGYTGYGYAYQYDYAYTDNYTHTDDESPAITGELPKKG